MHPIRMHGPTRPNPTLDTGLVWIMSNNPWLDLCLTRYLNRSTYDMRYTQSSHGPRKRPTRPGERAAQAGAPRARSSQGEAHGGLRERPDIVTWIWCNQTFFYGQPALGGNQTFFTMTGQIKLICHQMCTQSLGKEKKHWCRTVTMQTSSTTKNDERSLPSSNHIPKFTFSPIVKFQGKQKKGGAPIQLIEYNMLPLLVSVYIETTLVHISIHKTKYKNSFCSSWRNPAWDRRNKTRLLSLKRYLARYLQDIWLQPSPEKKVVVCLH